MKPNLLHTYYIEPNWSSMTKNNWHCSWGEVKPFSSLSQSLGNQYWIAAVIMTLIDTGLLKGTVSFSSSFAKSCTKCKTHKKKVFFHIIEELVLQNYCKHFREHAAFIFRVIDITRLQNVTSEIFIFGIPHNDDTSIPNYHGSSLVYCISFPPSPQCILAGSISERVNIKQDKIYSTGILFCKTVISVCIKRVFWYKSFNIRGKMCKINWKVYHSIFIHNLKQWSHLCTLHDKILKKCVI